MFRLIEPSSGQIQNIVLVHSVIDGPGVDSASNINEYQVCFLGVKAAGA
jgi:hypothetical protein